MIKFETRNALHIWHPYSNYYGFQFTMEEKKIFTSYLHAFAYHISGEVTRGLLLYYLVNKPLTGEPQSSKEIYRTALKVSLTSINPPSKRVPNKSNSLDPNL